MNSGSKVIIYVCFLYIFSIIFIAIGVNMDNFNIILHGIGLCLVGLNIFGNYLIFDEGDENE
jgi:hypothetical protein